MQTYPLAARARETVGRKTSYLLRTEGLVPAVVYGANLDTSLAVSIERSIFARLYKQAGESSIVELQIENGALIHTLIQDLQVDPMRGEVIHVDFRAIDMNKPVETHVKLVFTGESAAIKGGGGTLVRALENVAVRALPKDLPPELVVNISKLATFEDSIKIKDLVVSAGVEILGDAEQTVALVEAPRSEEEMAALNQAVDVDISKVEVVKKEKAAEEGEVEGAEAAPAAAKGKAEAKPAKAAK